MYSAYQLGQFACAAAMRFLVLAVGGRRARRIALARSGAEAKLVDHPGQEIAGYPIAANRSAGAGMILQLDRSTHGDELAA
jgi:hypothetical protein